MNPDKDENKKSEEIKKPLVIKKCLRCGTEVYDLVEHLRVCTRPRDYEDRMFKRKK